MKITVSLEKVLPRIHSHLSIIGKRAVNQHGERFYEELTTSSHEDSIFSDLMCSASESIVSSISDICVYYEDSKGVTFEIINERWAKLDEKLSHDLTEALEGSIYRYIVFYCLGVFLSSIFPALSQEKFPTFGKTYLEMAESILKRIVDLSYLKRPDNFAGLTYDEMFRASSEEFEGNKIGLFTIQRNGITISSYNGTADKIADINVPVNVSELKNDSGYLDSITAELVCDALGYTPFDENAFTKSNIREIAEIPSWAWGAKPKYSWYEINGLDEELDKKLSISDFGKYFDDTINDYSLGHEFSVEGSGQYISGFRLDGDKVIFQKSVFPDFSSSDVSWSDPGLDGVNLTVGDETYRLAFAGKSDGLFEKVKINDKYVIRANYPLYSVGDISAYGYSEGNLPSGGVTSFSQLEEVINAGVPKEKKYWGWDNGYKWLDAPEGGGDLSGYVQKSEIVTMLMWYYDESGNRTGYRYNPLGSTEGVLDFTDGLVPINIYNQHVKGYTEFKEKFDSMFAIVDGKIKALKDFFSVGDISAYGDANSQIPSAEISVIPLYDGGTEIAIINGTTIYAPAGGTADLTGYAKEDWVHANFLTEEELDTWIDKKGYATEGFVNSKAQEYADAALTEAKFYADTNFVNLDKWQEITGAKTFKAYQSFDGGLSTDTINILSQYPLITFGGETANDYSVRLYNSYAGLLEIQAQEIDYGPRLKIGNAVLSYDSDNHALKVSDINGAGSINLYATGDVAAFSGLGSGFDTLTDLTLTNKLTVGNSIQLGTNSLAMDKYGALVIDGGKQQEIYFKGTVYFDTDLELDNVAANDAHLLKSSIRTLHVGTSTNYKITEITTDGTNVYITINGKQYKLANA